MLERTRVDVTLYANACLRFAWLGAFQLFNFTAQHYTKTEKQLVFGQYRVPTWPEV